MSRLSFQWLRQGERTGAPLLAIHDLKVRLGVREILTGIDLEVWQGDHVRITGPNGSGKSTLMNAIMGIPPARVVKGDIVLRGKSIALLPTHKRAILGVGYMRQLNSVFENLSVGENIQISMGKSKSGNLKKETWEYSQSLPLDMKVGRLSGGQKKRLAWVMTILNQNYCILMLDEPFTGLSDAPGFPSNKTIIEITHCY